jgi:AcrR family transcriptional regulator
LAGTEDAKERLVAAAQALFATHGYDGTTLRAVARQARCDPALIAYHFGSKRGLFAHVMTLALSPTTVLERALPGDPDTVGVRLLAHVVRAWDRPDVAGSLSRLVQASMTDDDVMRTFREYLDREIMGPLVEYLGGADATARASAILTLVIGAIFGRYVVQVPSIARQAPERYLAALAPPARSASSRRR